MYEDEMKCTLTLLRPPKPILLMMSTFQGGSGGKNCGAFSSRVLSVLRIERFPGDAVAAEAEAAAAPLLAIADDEAEVTVTAAALDAGPAPLKSAAVQTRFADDGPPEPPLSGVGLGVGDGEAGGLLLAVAVAAAAGPPRLLLAVALEVEGEGTSSPPAPVTWSPSSDIRRTVSLRTPSGSVHNTTSQENRCSLFVFEFNAATSAPKRSIYIRVDSRMQILYYHQSKKSQSKK